jgi:CheY-like chemotaxis protein
MSDPMANISNWQVILADDDPDSLELISEMLIHEGATVHRAANGEQCLKILATVIPTLMVIDLSMPKPDGWEVLEYVRADSAMKNVRVVATTAYHSASVARQVQEMGFDAYLPKPLRSNQVMDVLTELVS